MPEFQQHAQPYMIVWEFHVREGMQQQFENVYGPDGDWARLFRQAAGYLETRLGRDATLNNRYLTLDFWASEQAFRNFEQEFAAQYKSLDRKCEGMTVREKKIGGFET
ncbi:MAG TPA: antibiotic biosynthesis monooxygenase [Terriglobales bacterium]|jgi:heme-degrading monooxygenase HmoA